MNLGISVCRAYVEKGGAYATDCGIMLGPILTRRTSPEELEQYHHKVHELQGYKIVEHDNGADLQTPL